MEQSVRELSRNNILVRLVKFVFGDNSHIDDCRVLWALAFFLPVFVVKSVRFVAWDFWKFLHEKDMALFASVLSFTIGVLLTSGCFSLYLIDPSALLTLGLYVGATIVFLLFLIAVLSVLVVTSELSKTPTGKDFLGELSEGIQRNYYRAEDSPPGKALGFILWLVGRILYWMLYRPLRAVFYTFLWAFNGIIYICKWQSIRS